MQLFYYFIESERDPVADPLVLWLTGGPGCSGFSALAFEIGQSHPTTSYTAPFHLTPLIDFIAGSSRKLETALLCSIAGPITFNYSAYTGGLPSLVLNNYSWTRVIIINGQKFILF